MDKRSAVYTVMKPGCIYRNIDLAHESWLDISDVCAVTLSLFRGNCVTRIRGDGLPGRKWLYITKQVPLNV